MKKVTQIYWVLILIFIGALPDVAYSQSANEDISAQPMKIKNIPYKNELNNLAQVIKKKVNTKDIDKSKFLGRTFYGNMIYKGSWNNLSITQVPYGIYSFKIGDPIEATPKMTTMSYDFMAGAYRKGNYYAIRPVSMFGSLTSVFYNNIDVLNYKMVSEKILDTDVNYEMLASAMGYDPITDKIYAIQYNSDLTGLYWSTFNRDDLSFEPISKWRGSFNVLCLIAIPDGRILCIGQDGNLYNINKTSGVPSMIGPTGVTPQLYSQSAFYDGKTGTILWSTQTNMGSQLYSVDINTASASLVASYTDNEQIIGLYTLENEAVDGAPAQIKDLKLNFAQSGSLNACIEFTVPSTSYNNNSLTDKVAIKVWNDGELLKDEMATPDAHYSIPVEYTNDNHQIAVVLSNNAGYGPYNILYQYAGNDSPREVGDLKFSLGTGEDLGKSMLSWTAPTNGVNGGYIDQSSLYYKIIRYPNNLIVADNYKGTSFSEVLPTEMHKYYYKIIPYNGASKEGVSAMTDTLTYGTAFSIPYKNIFDSKESTELFTILDNNKDGVSWVYNGKDEISASTYYNSEKSDDWLITPRLNLKAGKVYRFVADMRTAYKGYKENMKILLGTSIVDSLKTFTTEIADWQDLEITDDFTNKEAQFTVANDGEYYIAMGYLSEKNKGSMVRMKDIAVEEVASTKAPQSVKNLAITPDSNDELKAELSFTTPDKAMNGEALSSLKCIKIYRNDEESPIATIDNPALNSPIKWKDENVKSVGFNTYKVIPENSIGLGKMSEVTAFIGVYNAPYSEPFDSKSVMSLYSAKVSGLGEGEEYTFEYNKEIGSIGLNHFCMTVPFEAWIMSPSFKLDEESVYQLKFSYKNSGYGKPLAKYCTTLGTSDDPATHVTEIGALPSTTQSNFIDQSQEFVITNGGKYNISWYGKAVDKWDFMDFGIDNVAIKKITSAKAPNIIENLSMKSDASGALISTLSFKTPSKDYANRDLTSISKIEIYRGENSIPVKTFNSPKPGEEIVWQDNEPVKGKNPYLIIATNEFGRGKALIDSLYVGTDIPVGVDELTIKTDATNQKPTLTWNPVSKGKNGGVILKDKLIYSVISYDPTKAEDKQLSIIATNIKECSYTVNRAVSDSQAIEYYGVVASTPEGDSNLKLGAINVGKLYSLPYADSFANGASATTPWSIDENEDYTTWDATNSLMYDVVPQDGDNGVCYFYNGYYSELYANALLISPKICLNKVDSELSFWLYQGLSCTYTAKPTVQPLISVEDAPFKILGDKITLATGTPGWMKFTYNLSAFKNYDNIRIGFDGYSSGYNDVIYLDNIAIKDISGINSILENENIKVYGTQEGIIINGAENKKVEIYSCDGKLIYDFISPEMANYSIGSGIYLVKIGNKTYKTIVK